MVDGLRAASRGMEGFRVSHRLPAAQILSADPAVRVLPRPAATARVSQKFLRSAFVPTNVIYCADAACAFHFDISSVSSAGASGQAPAGVLWSPLRGAGASRRVSFFTLEEGSK